MQLYPAVIVAAVERHEPHVEDGVTYPYELSIFAVDAATSQPIYLPLYQARFESRSAAREHHAEVMRGLAVNVLPDGAVWDLPFKANAVLRQSAEADA